MWEEFLNWIKLKFKIQQNSLRPLFEEREIWYCVFGQNIGREINGKNNPDYSEKLFLRPALVLKKLNKESFIGIPLTSKQKVGSWFYEIEIRDANSYLVFSQIRSFDAKRLKYSIAKIGISEFKNIQNKFTEFLVKK
jgi:hypothetical protein